MPIKSLGLFPASLSTDPLFCLEFVEITNKIETTKDLKARERKGVAASRPLSPRSCSRGGGRRGKYFTHDKSYYPVPQTSMKFANINFMQPLLSEEISPETETAMKELV